MADSFFIQEAEDRFVATDHTRGPWTSDAQHAGPPAALLGRAIERADARSGFQVARVTFEILRPVPIDLLKVDARIRRPGRSVELVEATLSHEGEPVMLGRAWRIRTDHHEFEAVVPDPKPPPPPNQGQRVEPFGSGGYLAAMETSFTAGSFVEPGPATAWFRMRYPLIENERPSPLTRVLIAADSGNGISATIDWSRWFFINPDLSVYLHRLPLGEWVCLDAMTIPEAHGIGVAASTIWDEEGPIGRGIQSLFIGPRPTE